ncbi:hypothetical protein LINPERPRIM_LOCUS9460 [Linum perenne]
MSKFSVKLVWDTLRNRLPLVNWYNLIWKSHGIPKHCMIAWLAIKGKLITKEIMLSCSYTQKVRGILLMPPNVNWEEEVAVCSGDWNGDTGVDKQS